MTNEPTIQWRLLNVGRLWIDSIRPDQRCSAVACNSIATRAVSYVQVGANVMHTRLACASHAERVPDSPDDPRWRLGPLDTLDVMEDFPVASMEIDCGSEPGPTIHWCEPPKP